MATSAMQTEIEVSEMTNEQDLHDSTVIVIDDSPDQCELLQTLLGSVGHRVRAYSSAMEFLASEDVGAPGCLLLDMRMPGMSGLELQDRLNQMEVETPIILVTGHAEVPLAVQAMRNGAIDVLQKPYSQQVLLDRLQQALELDRQTRERARNVAQAQQRIALLSSGERDVLERLRMGRSNKEIAQELGLTRRGIEARRANVMRKLEADSLADLLRLVMLADSANKS
ncbi:MAG: response regulator [Planctomycetota bacterium]|nr:response regulator [Planctomycetota bacterium]